MAIVGRNVKPFCVLKMHQATNKQCVQQMQYAHFVPNSSVQTRFSIRLKKKKKKMVRLWRDGKKYHDNHLTILTEG